MEYYKYNINIRRVFFLHNLGIAIQEPFLHIIEELQSFFDIDETKTFDWEKNNTYYLNKDDGLLFQIDKRSNDKIELFTSYYYKKMVKNIRSNYIGVYNIDSIIRTMAILILEKKGYKFNVFHH